MALDSGLAGPAVRKSEQFNFGDASDLSGFLKLRLGHSHNGSVLVPEQLFIECGEWRFFQPSFFGPPILGFNMEPGLHLAKFNLDVGDPRATELNRLITTIRSDGLVKIYEDGAQLYRCAIQGPSSLPDNSSGRAFRQSDGDFSLALFHVTNPSAAAGIKNSGQLWSSAWNLQGTRRLANVAYVYLTSLPQIRNEADLRRIAMASDGLIHFQTTSARQREQVLQMKVYRESTTGRTESLPIAVSSALFAPPHLLLHRPPGGAYYEIVAPEIYRIGLRPDASLSYVDGVGGADATSLKRFDYIIVGDAAQCEGLAAPYDEEETAQIMHLEPLRDQDIFAFWQRNANSDQVTGRVFESRELGRDGL